MIRDYLDEANVRLVGLNIRNLTGLNDKGEINLEACLKYMEWDIHLARALRLKTANLSRGKASVDGGSPSDAKAHPRCSVECSQRD